MAFYFSRRKLQSREVEHAGELNIVPYLDILMYLIIFMLLSMTGLAAFGILNVTAPNYGPPGGAAMTQENSDQPKLLLSVLISKKGFFVAGTGAVLGQTGADGTATPGEGAPTIPKRTDGSYDFAALNATMINIKKEFPNETKIILGPEA